MPILVSGHGVNKLLGVPKLFGGTEENAASTMVAIVEDWGVAERVKAMCFDTTSANTGSQIGACVLLEQKLGKDLQLACRHHILELLSGYCLQGCDGRYLRSSGDTL